MQSKYKGVTYATRAKGSRNYHERWRAQITVGGKTRYLGTFEDEEQAARRVDNARLCLQEFFPTPLDIDKLNRPLTEQNGITRRVEELLALLEAERAQRFTHEAVTLSPVEEIRRAIQEEKEALRTFVAASAQRLEYLLTVLDKIEAPTGSA